MEISCGIGTTRVEFLLLKVSYEGGHMVDLGKMVRRKQDLDPSNLMELYNSLNR